MDPSSNTTGTKGKRTDEGIEQVLTAGVNAGKTTMGDEPPSLPSAQKTIQLFKEQLESKDSAVRIKAVKGLPVVAVAVGTDNTVSGLLPLCIEVVRAGGDELLLTLAVSVVELLGVMDLSREPTAIPAILNVLARMAESESLIVRDAAADGFVNAGAHLKPDTIKGEYLEMLRGFIANRSIPTVCDVGMAMIPVCIPHVVEDIQMELAGYYMKFMKDQSAILKMHVAASLRKSIPLLNDDIVSRSCCPVVDRFFTDPHTAVRRVNLSTLLVLAERKNAPQYLQWFLQSSGDNAWSVRMECVRLLPEAARILVSTASESGTIIISTSHLASSFAALMEDLEPEVQKAFFKVFPEVIGQFSKLSSFPGKFAKLVIAMYGKPLDSIPLVAQCERAKCMMKTIEHIGEILATETALPSIVNALTVGELDTRIAILNRMQSLIQVIPPEVIIDKISPLCSKLVSDPSWHVKTAFAHGLPRLAKKIGEPTFTETILPSLLRWFRDATYSVRHHAGTLFAELAHVYGEEWLTKNVLPHALQSVRAPDYKIRVSAAQALGNLASVSTSDAVQTKIIPAVAELCEDPIANVRIAAVESLPKIKEASLQNWDHMPEETAKKMASDSITDVALAAEQALREMQGVTRK